MMNWAKNLDDEAMAKLVDGQNPYAAWQAIQAEASIHRLK